MSASTGVNVLRWSALGFGVFYGAYHQLSLSARDKANASKKEWEHKESLIRQAKAEWARSHPEPKAAASANANDPNADLNTILGITDN
ncbi:ATP synthase subunit e [Parastagonospora nodorum]|nr:ATP synthase subunit e [Parastagonospora nodorum]KAH4018235.1 ATP synthase subunit e [Parastagonospora nodorum]KAH4092718.1 ATP synthase subunit e [Parastagonospora nodorum]KAH4115284.1 ATP synthase subunit e [Parastagonospora nodorum]KAH4159262.1 ATP synthase subunit e [Parastagonospora nodorum]